MRGVLIANCELRIANCELELTDSALRLQQLKAEIEADNKANARVDTLCVRRQENESTQGA